MICLIGCMWLFWRHARRAAMIWSDAGLSLVIAPLGVVFDFGTPLIWRHRCDSAVRSFSLCALCARSILTSYSALFCRRVSKHGAFLVCEIGGGTRSIGSFRLHVHRANDEGVRRLPASSFRARVYCGALVRHVFDFIACLVLHALIS